MDISTLSSVGDKAIFITGGAKGIGRTISEYFVANGVKAYISTGDAKSCETSLTNARPWDGSRHPSRRRYTDSLTVKPGRSGRKVRDWAPRAGDYKLTEGWDTIRLLVCRYEGCG